MFRSDRVHKDVCVLMLVANCTYSTPDMCSLGSALRLHQAS